MFFSLCYPLKQTSDIHRLIYEPKYSRLQQTTKHLVQQHTVQNVKVKETVITILKISAAVRTDPGFHAVSKQMTYKSVANTFCQACGYLPSCIEHCLCQQRITLLGDRGTYVSEQLAQIHYMNMEQPEVEPLSLDGESYAQLLNHHACKNETSTTRMISCIALVKSMDVAFISFHVLFTSWMQMQ